jgi:threonine/homoserine/homoserine lactone efflux protein
MLDFFAKGIVVGLLTGIPVGPVGAMCLKTALSKGSRYGLLSGVSSAIADSILAILAVLGFSLISGFVYENETYFHLFGGIILIVIGVHMFLSKEKKHVKERKIDLGSMIKISVSTFLVAFINPSTIITFFAIFSSSRFLYNNISFLNKVFLIAGVFLGCMLWWFVLIIAAAIFREKMDFRKIKLVNKIISILLIVSGIYVFLDASKLSQYIDPSKLLK